MQNEKCKMKNATCPLLSDLCGESRALCRKQGNLQKCGEENFSLFTFYFSFLLSLGVLGLMPHPERHILPTQHPRWTREGLEEQGAGRVIFENAVRLMKKG
jgi:hypothetical protein